MESRIRRDGTAQARYAVTETRGWTRGPTFFDWFLFVLGVVFFIAASCAMVVSVSSVSFVEYGGPLIPLIAFLVFILLFAISNAMFRNAEVETSTISGVIIVLLLTVSILYKMTWPFIENFLLPMEKP